MVIGVLVGARKLAVKNWNLLSPLGSRVEEKKELPLEKYEFEKLKKRKPKPSEIVLEKELGKSPEFT